MPNPRLEPAAGFLWPAARPRERPDCFRMLHKPHNAGTDDPFRSMTDHLSTAVPRGHWTHRIPVLGPVAMVRPRWTSAVVVGAIAYFAFDAFRPSIRLIAAWDTGSFLFLLTTILMAVRETPADVRRRAKTMDQGAAIVLLLTLVGVLACLLTIITATEDLHAFAGSKRASAVVVATTVILTWMVTHSSFALHYAHLYYGDSAADPAPSSDRDAPAAADDGAVGGLDFPGGEAPDYLDFAYFSFVLGMTFQVSDVTITDRGMRRLSLLHGLVSFFFTTVIVALTINLLAGLAQA